MIFTKIFLHQKKCMTSTCCPMGNEYVNFPTKGLRKRLDALAKMSGPTLSLLHVFLHAFIHWVPSDPARGAPQSQQRVGIICNLVSAQLNLIEPKLESIATAPDSLTNHSFSIFFFFLLNVYYQNYYKEIERWRLHIDL